MKESVSKEIKSLEERQRTANADEYKDLEIKKLQLLLFDARDSENEKTKEYLKTIFGIILGALLGGLCTRYLQKDQTTTVINPMHPATIQIYREKNSLNYSSLDTTLVRVVNFPTNQKLEK